MADFINTVDVIGDEALTDSIIDRSITEYKDNSILSIGAYAFYNCSKLTSVDFPAVTSIDGSAFVGCSKLTSVDFPAVTSIGGSAFNSCSRLTSVNFPAATSIGNNAFIDCSQLTSVNFPVATSIGKNAFYNCSQLTSVDFPAATSIGDYAFNGCSQLTALILRNNVVCTLSSKNAFYSTLIASGTGYIYIPASLKDQYTQSTNWSTYSNKFRALEDYTVDGTTTGALDPTKI